MRTMVCCTLGLGAFATLLLALGSSSLAQDSHMSALSDFLDHPDKPIYVRGDYFRAIQVAYGDFAKVLARRRVKTSGVPDQDSSEYPMRMSRIEYYDIYVEESGDSYRIHIAPTRRDPLHEVFGGGATYIVDRVSFKITDITTSK